MSAELESALDILRNMVKETSDWSQRWAPEEQPWPRGPIPGELPDCN